MADARVIYTVGHSTRSAHELTELLQAHGVRAVADVRRVPKSRRYPHFNADQLARWLPDAGIEYVPFLELGGWRRPAKDSPNSGWRNSSFRGYADFMQTQPFLSAVNKLTLLAEAKPTATMCSEAVPFRCHRSLISDALLVRGWRVLDIMSVSRATPHKLTPFAKVEALTITYPPEGSLLFPA